MFCECFHGNAVVFMFPYSALGGWVNAMADYTPYIAGKLWWQPIEVLITVAYG